MDLSPEEVRVLGALIEKQRTTPDQYPLTLNSLRLACNQSTNRDPVVDYDEPTLRDALERLARRRFVRLASGHGSRSTKYRHLLDEALGVSRPEMAVLGVLLLRGPQTPGELRARTERLYPFGAQDELREAIERLVERELVVRIARRPGQKEERYAHRLGDDAPEADPAAETSSASPGAAGPLEERVARLEAELAELRDAVARVSAGVHTS